MNLRQHGYKTLSAGLLLAGLLGLTACSSGGNNAPAGASAHPSATAAPAVSPAASLQPAASMPPAGGEAPATAAPASTEPETADSGQRDASAQLQEMLALAKQGKAPGIEFAVHDNLIDDVKAAWGEPDREDWAGKGMYATYTDKKAAIGFNKGSRIFDVRSSSAEVQALTREQVEGALGKPDNVTTSGDDEILIYQAKEGYQLKFAIPKSTGKVDHISVFSEKDSFNNMAG
ncbi:YjgB family protein [Paenibacillus spiritus]|nr:YjgB family protein [Paenibacillus spiritus]